jgi:hypothetical protein
MPEVDHKDFNRPIGTTYVDKVYNKWLIIERLNLIDITIIKLRIPYSKSQPIYFVSLGRKAGKGSFSQLSSRGVVGWKCKAGGILLLRKAWVSTFCIQGKHFPPTILSE